MRITLATLLLMLLAGGEAGGNEARPAGVRVGLFTVTLPVIAVLHDELFAGEAIGHLDRTGTIEIRSVLDANSRCIGEFHHTGLTQGVAEVRCDDGTRAELAFKSLGLMSGYGRGATPRGPASFTFGLDADEAAARLDLPAGRRLVRTASGLRLE